MRNKTWSNANYITKLKPADVTLINREVNPLWNEPTMAILKASYRQAALENRQILDESTSVPPHKVPAKVRQLLGEVKRKKVTFESQTGASSGLPGEPAMSSHPLSTGFYMEPSSQGAAKPVGSTLRSSLKPSGTQSESQVTDTEEHPGVSGKSVSQGSPDKTEEERSTEKMNETNLKKEDNIAIQQPFRPVSVDSVPENDELEIVSVTSYVPPKVPYTIAYDTRISWDPPKKPESGNKDDSSTTKTMTSSNENNSISALQENSALVDLENRLEKTKKTEKSTRTTTFGGFKELIPSAPAFFIHPPAEIDPYLIVRPPKRIHDLSLFRK